MTAPFRLGLVGAGGIAQAYGAAIAGGTGARLVAVADTNAEAAAALATGCGARVFGTHRDLAAAGVCDGVIVTTPPATHADIAIDILSAGLPVLCEKPLSVDMDGAERMARAATESGVLLSMASKFRFCDDLIQARAMVADGLIGTPLILENCFTGVVDMVRRWNSDPAVSGGGVLIDNGTHSADIARWFLGPITGVLAVAGPAHPGNRGRGLRDPDRAHAIRRAGPCRDGLELSQGPHGLSDADRQRGRGRGRLAWLAPASDADRPVGALWQGV